MAVKTEAGYPLSGFRVSWSAEPMAVHARLVLGGKTRQGRPLSMTGAALFIKGC